MVEQVRSRDIKSLRLILSKKVAERCGFAYDLDRYKNGGFFDVIQLQMVASKLDEYKRLRERIKAEHPDLKRILE